MLEDMAESLAKEALSATRHRMEFSECYDEAARNVAAAIKAAAEQAEADALSFKTVEVSPISFGEMF